METRVCRILIFVVFIKANFALLDEKRELTSVMENKDLFRIKCGPISCDITYQYCDNGMLGTRPVCSLCADICSTNRVGTQRIYVDHCLDVCPVYWYKQEQAKLTTTTTTTELPTTSPEQGSLLDIFNLPVIVLVTLLCMVSCVLLCVILIIVLKRNRRTCSRSDRPHDIRSNTPHITRLKTEHSGYHPESGLLLTTMSSDTKHSDVLTLVHCTHPAR